jgi:hypothetical protein
MSSHEEITYYLIAGFAFAAVVAGYFEFMISTKSDLKQPAVDPVHDEGTHRRLEMKNEY